VSASCSDDSDPSFPSTISAPPTSIGGTTGGPPDEEPDGTGSSSDSNPTEGPDPDGTSSSDPDPTGGAEPDVPVCNPADDLEPNNSEDSAHFLDNITDEDGSGSLVESILAGDQDVDWYAYMGKDVAFAYVDPTGALATDMSLRLCLFVECAIGATPAPDCINSVYDESPSGFRGCCNTGENAFVSIDLTCGGGGGDDSAFVLMRVDHGVADECVPYDLEYHF
jgi:hypothetical protein